MVSIFRALSDDHATSAIPHRLEDFPGYSSCYTRACAYNLVMHDAEVSLPNDVALCHELIRQQAASLENAQRRIEQLEHAMDVLLRQKYGPRSERLDPNQLRLFTEESDEPVPSADPEVVPENSAKPKRTWKRRGRQTIPEHLPRVPIVIELSEHERACPGCGGLRAHFDDEISEQLDYVPASLFVRQFIRRKYACRSCQEHVAIPPKPPQPIDKGLPGPGLLAHVITNKFAYHLPLYRQEQILAHYGVTISRTTLCGWLAQSVELFAPLYDLMIKRVRGSRIIWTDDTTVPVWDPTLPKTRTGRFWVYVGDVLNPYSVYDFTPRRNRDGPERFLEGFQGYLQADAFAGYDRLCAGANVIRVACWAHARRKFYDARHTDPLPAHQALARIGQLYAIEEACKELSAEERYVIRQRDAVPLLNALGEWLDEQSRKILPKSPVGQAISYARNQWEDLQTYTLDGELTIDNNVSERSVRAQAIGRKNYLFVGSDRGGRTAATLYSLVGTCKRHEVDPFAFLKDILERLPTHAADRLGELLPDVWIAANPQARVKIAS
jgi:transposase